MDQGGEPTSLDLIIFIYSQGHFRRGLRVHYTDILFQFFLKRDKTKNPQVMDGRRAEVVTLGNS